MLENEKTLPEVVSMSKSNDLVQEPNGGMREKFESWSQEVS